MIAKLTGGQLVLAANVGEGGGRGAILGGTGEYPRARGTFTTEPIEEGRERITFRVLR